MSEIIEARKKRNEEHMAKVRMQAQCIRFRNEISEKLDAIVKSMEEVMDIMGIEYGEDEDDSEE